MPSTNLISNGIIIPYKNYPGGPGTFITQLTFKGKDSSFTTKRTKNSKIILVIVYYNPIKLILYKYLFKIKIVHRLDGMAFPKFRIQINSMKSVITFYISKFIYQRLADHVVFQSKSVEKNITDVFGPPKRNYSLIYNGVCIEKVSSIKNLNQPINIAYWGSRITVNQLKLLLLISEELDKKEIDYKLHIIGSLEKTKTDLTKKLSKNFYFYGPRTREQLYQIAEKIDLFLMVTGSSSPNTLVECLAFTIPVVGYSNLGNIEIINTKSGYLFESSIDIEINITNFINGIQVVLSEYESYTIHIKKQYSDYFSCETMRDNYFSVFKNLFVKDN